MTRRGIFQRLWAWARGFGFKRWFLLVLNVAMALACAACGLGLRAVSGTLGGLDAADRFRGESETRFSQLACFLPVGQGKSEEEIFQFRQTLDTALLEQSMAAPENGSLYIDAYSGAAGVSARTEGGSASVEALGVGGDFFYFHPMDLLSGSYIDGDDLMDDLIVLDEETAWRLYGSAELAGMTVYINDTPFVVSGVVSRDTDFATARAYGGEGGIFMSYSALSRLVDGVSVSCYEIVMPNPISGYAKGLLEEKFPVGKGDVVENSGRYRLGRLMDVIKDFGGRSMRVNGVIYPYWENAARLTEDYAALLMVLTAAFALCPLLFALVFVIRTLRRGFRFVKAKLPEKIDSAVERRKEERLERAYKKKAGGDRDG